MNINKVRKVRRQRRPGYPARPEVMRDPELLRRHVPSAWKKSAQVTAALSIILASASAQDSLSKGKALKIAPIFEHGEGRGTTGCVVMNPPDFLSEEEAVRIIIKELVKAGIQEPEQTKSLPDILIPKYETGIGPSFRNKDGSESWTVEYVEKERKPLVFDLYESTRSIAIEYVSLTDEDFVLSGDKHDANMTTAPSYNFLSAAKYLREDLQKNTSAREIYCGIFYDPCPRPKERDWMNLPPGPERDKKRSEAMTLPVPVPADLLRAQVRDFIEWLKGQGAI